MPDPEGLRARYASLAPQMVELAQSGKRILAVTHIDADGLCSGSLVFSALKSARANITLRTVPDLDPKGVAALASQKYDYYILTDLASTLLDELESALAGRYLVIDHHQIKESDSQRPSVVNAWAYGYDGGREACSSTMAYFFAASVDPSARALASLAVVGALADRQDSGPGRSLTGLNRAALEHAQSAGLISTANDLMLTGRETRPVHESVALTSTPLLKGVTGNKDAILAALHQSGLALKEGSVWRSVSSLSADEKKKVIEVLASMVGQAEGATEALAGLFGEVYTLELEDPYTPLRDAREFGTLLNSCGRMEASGVGVAVCLGDRSESLAAAMKTLSDYRAGISRALESLTSDPSRISTQGSLVLVRGEGAVDEKLLGPVLSILTSTPSYRDKVVVGFATSRDSDVKVSSRVGDSYPGVVNLAKLMRDSAEAVSGVGGGHSMAAGAKIPASMADAFSKAIAERVSP
ncbi:MAG: DHH family phosphoesterase [archaeon]|nr:MAG: DHH family phosphoesterase [archaeon]